MLNPCDYLAFVISTHNGQGASDRVYLALADHSEISPRYFFDVRNPSFKLTSSFGNGYSIDYRLASGFCGDAGNPLHK